MVSNESGAGVSRVALDYNIPIANAILTTENDEQAVAHASKKKASDAAKVAVECANGQPSFVRTIQKTTKNGSPRIEYRIFSDGLPIMTLRPSESFNIQPTTIGTLFTRNTHEKPTPPRTRALPLQAIYQAGINKTAAPEIAKNIRELSQAPNMDEELFNKLFSARKPMPKEYMEKSAPCSTATRKISALSNAPFCWFACHELSTMPETPYPVIINEAIEVTKTFGGTDGHKFVNGIPRPTGFTHPP